MTPPPTGEGAEAPAPRLDVAAVDEAEGALTVSDIITGSKRLAGREVRVRATVVKFTPKIMGKNWIHVQDGSGGEGTNDLIVTTAGTFSVGNAVKIRGVVSVDRDFGYGLRYPVLIEDAAVTLK